MLTHEQAHKAVQRNKSILWLLANLFNDFAGDGSNIPADIKLDTGELLDKMYEELSEIEEYIKGNEKGG